MAVLDRYLEALRMPGAQAITFKANAPVEILINGAARAVNNAVTTPDQLVALLAEVIGPDFQSIASGAVKEYPYQSPLGPVKVSVTVQGGVLMARAQPWTEAAAPSPATPSPAATTAAVQPSAAARAAAAAAEASIRPPPRTPPARTTGGQTVVPGGSRKPQHMDELFMPMLDMNASDLHIKTDKHPMVRLHGEMEVLPGGWAPISSAEVWDLLRGIMPERNQKQVQEIWDTDFAYEVKRPDGTLRARMRCNVFKSIWGWGAVFRQIPSKIQTAQDLKLPPAVLKLCEYPKGLVLVTGPTGSGKSTTLAAMIDYINDTRTDHIITIEDPVEFVHADKKSHINQREVGANTMTFKAALRAALREDPDVVLIGELRDLETMAIAIETAETGHLVFGTLHTNTAASTIDRLIDQFPADRQEQIRAMLSESLIGVVSQTLCRRKEGGRVAALEILIVTSAVSNLIREGKTFQIPSTMQTSRGMGMQTMNDALLDLVKNRVIDAEEAYRASVTKKELGIALTRAGFRGAWTDDKAA